MINQATISRIDELWSTYRALDVQHREAMVQIALAELPESVHQSNAIENSTLTLEETERIVAGGLPRASHELREVYEASNLAWVTSDLVRAGVPTRPSR